MHTPRLFLLLAFSLLTLCDKPSAPSSSAIATELWRIAQPQSENYADLTFVRHADSTLTCSGNWYYQFFDSEVTCKIMSGSAVAVSDSLRINAQGTASYPPDSTGKSESSGFTLVLTGKFLSGAGAGNWEIGFTDSSWDKWAPYGTFTAMRKSGSGVMQ